MRELFSKGVNDVYIDDTKKRRWTFDNVTRIESFDNFSIVIRSLDGFSTVVRDNEFSRVEVRLEIVG